MTGVEEVICPYGPHANTATEAELLARSSQEILDYPDYIPDVLEAAEDRLREQLSLMLDVNPEQAESLITRRLRTILRGPMMLIVDIGMAADLSRYTAAEQAARIEYVGRQKEDYGSVFMDAYYHRSADNWMKNMLELDGQAQYLLHSGRDPNSAIFNQCDGALLALLPRLQAAREAVGVRLPDCYYLPNSALLLYHLVRENIVSTFDTIVAGYLAVASATDGETVNAESATDDLYNNIDVLGRIATVNKETLVRILPDANGGNKHTSVFMSDFSDLSRLCGVFTYADGILSPTHPSIANGGWRWPRNCSGRFGLRLPDQTNIEAYHTLCQSIGRPDIAPAADGTTNAVHTLFALGITVGRHTIFNETALQSACATGSMARAA